MPQTKLIPMIVGLMLVLGSGCGDDDGKPSTTAKADSGGGTDESATLPAEVTCSSGTTMKLSDLSDCRAYFDKWFAECCPKAPAEYTKQSMQALLCTPGVDAATLNQACKTALEQSFDQTCAVTKSTAGCQ